MRRSKYNVSSKEDRTYEGTVFDSKKEMARYIVLKGMEDAGEITDLRLQPKFPITINDVLVFTYYGDFWYVTPGGAVVEDCKGMRTPVYKLKKKCVEAHYGFEITES